MRVIQFEAYGTLDELHMRQVPALHPIKGDILIRVMAAAVNPADVKWRSGMFRELAPIKLPHVLGYDVAGVVADLGDEAHGFAVGDRVVAMLDPITKGGYAEFAVAGAQAAALIPPSLEFDIAAAIPCAGLAGVQSIERMLQPKAGQTVLITGATGAVGRFAVYAALQLGARVVAAVRPAYREKATGLGASTTIALGEAWQGPFFHHVFDTVGGRDVAELCRHLAPHGGIVTVATTPIDPTGLSTTPVFMTVRQDGERLARLARSVAAGDIMVPIAQRLDLNDAREAHRLMEAGGLGGKIILHPRPDCVR